VISQSQIAKLIILQIKISQRRRDLLEKSGLDVVRVDVAQVEMRQTRERRVKVPRQGRYVVFAKIQVLQTRQTHTAAVENYVIVRIVHFLRSVLQLSRTMNGKLVGQLVALIAQVQHS